VAIESWREYVIRVSVDEDAITVEQYNRLCERLAAEADSALPGVDVMVSGGVEVVSYDENGNEAPPPEADSAPSRPDVAPPPGVRP
jgi:hypothetical protein